MKHFQSLLVLLSVISASLMISQSAYSKTYTKDQFLAMGAHEVSGLVVGISAHSFVIKISSGDEINIHTDNGITQFIPEDERLMIGDNVCVAYIAPLNASNSIDGSLAYMIEFTEKVPRNFPTDEMECVIAIYKQSKKACYLPKLNKMVTFEGQFPEKKYHGNWISTKYGERVNVLLKVIPARIGNGYIYKLRDIFPAKD